MLTRLSCLANFCLTAHELHGLCSATVHASRSEVVADIKAPGSAAQATKAIVIAVDGGELSKRMVAYLLTLFTPRMHRLVLLSVVNTHDFAAMMIGDNLRGSSSRAAMLDEHAATTRKLLQGYADDLSRVGFACRAVLGWGSPARVILEQAGEQGAELLVLGTRDTSGVSRALLGSTSDYVVDHARTPVLIVKPSELRLPSSPSVPRRFDVANAPAGAMLVAGLLARPGDYLRCLALDPADSAASGMAAEQASVVSRSCAETGISVEGYGVVFDEGSDVSDVLAAATAGADVLVVDGGASSLFRASAATHIIHKVKTNAVLVVPASASSRVAGASASV